MKLDRQDSLKFKQIKKMERRRKIIMSLAVGTIAMSIVLYSNDIHTGNDIINQNDYIAINEQEILFDKNNNETDIEDLPIDTNEITIIEKDIPIINGIPFFDEPVPSSTPSAENVTPTPAPTSKKASKEEKQAKKMVALSFDDGPSKTLTPELLKILEDNDCTATFFVLGNRVKKYSDIIYEVYSAGNEIGNHSYDHSDFTKLTKKQIKTQLRNTNEAIYQVTNEYPTLFRPPYGAIDGETKACSGYPLILWSIDSNDWRKISDEEVINNVISGLADGKIILMHDIHERTIKVCKTLIPQIKKKGYEIVSIEELCESKQIELKDGSVYSKIKKN